MDTSKKVTRKKHPRGMEGPIIQSLRTLFRTVGPIAPGLMSALAYKLWFTPRRYRRPLWELNLAATADETYVIDAKGIKVPVWAWGQGPTVLLVHGWEGRGTQLGSFVAPLNARGYRVVCFDAPAHGNAAGKTTDAVEMHTIIDAIAAREKGLHGVISHSFGAIPASFAMRGGLKLDRAVFISPPSELGAMLTIFQRELAIPEKVMTRLKTRVERRFPDHGSRLWQEFSTHASARHFNMPGMVVHDRGDAIVPISQGRLVANSWQSVQHMETEGLGHRKILLDPGVVEQVTLFLDPLVK